MGFKFVFFFIITYVFHDVDYNPDKDKQQRMEEEQLRPSHLHTMVHFC